MFGRSRFARSKTPRIATFVAIAGLSAFGSAALLATACGDSSEASGDDSSADDAAAPAYDGAIQDDGGGAIVDCRLCFPLEDLEGEANDLANTATVAAFDGEPLSALLGGARALGFVTTSFDGGAPSDASVLQATNAMRCGADLRSFPVTFDGKRVIAIVAVPRFLTVVRAHADLFGAVVEPIDIEAVVAETLALPVDARARRLGALAGFPDATLAAQDGSDAGGDAGPVLHLPTWTDPRTGITYRVPAGYTRSAADDALLAETKELVLTYDRKRTTSLGAAGQGPGSMVRGLLAGEDGRCGLANGKFTVDRTEGKILACVDPGGECTRDLRCCSFVCNDGGCQ